MNKREILPFSCKLGNTNTTTKAKHELIGAVSLNSIKLHITNLTFLYQEVQQDSKKQQSRSTGAQ